MTAVKGWFMNRLVMFAMIFAQGAQAFAAAAAEKAAPAAGGAGQGAAAATSPLGSPLFMIGMLIIVFYFIILRPQKAEQRKREQLLNSVAKGDQVMTSGGIYGTVESVDTTKGTVNVVVAPKVTMKFSKAAVSTIIRKKDARDADAPLIEEK